MTGVKPRCEGWSIISRALLRAASSGSVNVSGCSSDIRSAKSRGRTSMSELQHWSILTVVNIRPQDEKIAIDRAILSPLSTELAVNKGACHRTASSVPSDRGRGVGLRPSWPAAKPPSLLALAKMACVNPGQKKTRSVNEQMPDASDAAAEKPRDRLLRDCWGRSIFDFCNNISTFRT